MERDTLMHLFDRLEALEEHSARIARLETGVTSLQRTLMAYNGGFAVVAIMVPLLVNLLG